MKHCVDIQGNRHERPAGELVEWRISGYGVVEHCDRMLLVQTVWSESWTWDLPGGGIRLMPEETIVDGIVRDVYEETGHGMKPIPDALMLLHDAFFYAPSGRYFRSIVFMLPGELSDDPDPVWRQPEDEVLQVGWVDRAGLHRNAVHWLHWDALVRLGHVDEGTP